MMTSIRFGLALVALIVLLLICLPVMARGLWPYSEGFTEAEKWETPGIEVKALIWTSYWLFVFTNGFAVTHTFDTSLTIRAIVFWLLIDVLALLGVIWFHRSQVIRRKRLNERRLGNANHPRPV